MPVPIPSVNVELGIGDTIRAIGEIQNRAREEMRGLQDKALTELREQLEVTLTVITKLENLFVDILRGYRTPEITGNRDTLQEHLNQTRILLESRNLLPSLDTAMGAIEAAASSPRFKSADYREMVEGLRELERKLYGWRMALVPSSSTDQLLVSTMVIRRAERVAGCRPS
jgi:FMN phosphatase YigB (HAD superfamily)